MAEIYSMQTPIERPLSLSSFQGKLDKFQSFIAEVTLQDSDASSEEKRQSINDNLRYEYFCDYVRTLFGADIKSQDLKAIHRKLSTNPEVKIDWSEVFGYFQAENEEAEAGNEEISVFTVSKRKTIGEAAGDKKRRDTIQSVIYSPEFDYYVTASQKGALSIYNGKLRLQNCIDINESAWMTSCQYLPKLRKVIATTERSIVIWDHRAKGKNQSNIHVIKPLEHSPQCMCLVPSEDEHSDAVLIGDDAGFINLVQLTHNDVVVKASKDQKRVLKYNIIDPSTLTVPIVRRKFHNEWVLQVQYLPDIKHFASCSPGDRLSFVIANFKRIYDTGAVSELAIPRGVNAFCYSEKSNIFATGGVDKTIRVWHPNILSRPTGKMVGHLFTIVDLVINEKDQHIISLSTARVFRVWDIHTLACLQVFTDSDGRSGDRRISTMLFDGRRDRLFTGSSTIDMWPMTRTVQDTMSVPHTHDHPLTTIILNLSISQIVTICTESVIKVWEVETGRQMYQILDAHGPNIEVTSATVNYAGTRMITGAFDGSMKVWEFGSGQEIKSFSIEETKDEDHDQSILWMKYLMETEKEDVDMNEQENEKTSEELDMQDVKAPTVHKVLVGGWNNKLKIFEDDENGIELTLLFEFDGMYEWPIPPLRSSTSSTSPTRSDSNRRAAHDDDGDDVVPRKDNILILNEVCCYTLLDHADLHDSLVTGCSNGNLILWSYKQKNVSNVFELAKAELASSYDSHRHRSKDQFPHRVNDVVALCHKIFRPDPEEVKRRKHLRKKRMQEEEGVEDEDADEESAAKEDEKENPDVKEEDDDPAEEVNLDMQESEEEESNSDQDSKHRDLAYGIDNEPIKMVEIVFPPVIASCHQDTNLRFWSTSGELLCSVTPSTRVLSPLTALCCDEFSDQVICADAKGYITVFDVSEFLEKAPASVALQARSELIKQLVCWRAHLMKVVSLSYVNSSRVLISASTDGSVRVWYPHRGHYVGYFGQHRIWHVERDPSLPSSPVLPYDITEGPLNPVNVRSGRRKPQTKKYEYPLVFDADRWRPFRRSAYVREQTQRATNQQPSQGNLNVIEIRNKKFFSALVKPKVDKSGLESDKPADADSSAIFHHLPVYRLQTPPVQPQPLNMGYINGLGNEQGDAGKAGAVGTGKTGVKISLPHSQGLKNSRASRHIPARKPAANGHAPSRRR
ncbi:unnamed protein product [Clavelina lepadiformis]|uniref:WD repeat-containing protein 64 n=1 Tax=Clavelina lepadiformis TaxID=159417 RepID=A0ABP0FKZ8_CLALP